MKIKQKIEDKSWSSLRLNLSNEQGEGIRFDIYNYKQILFVERLLYADGLKIPSNLHEFTETAFSIIEQQTKEWNCQLILLSFNHWTDQAKQEEVDKVRRYFIEKKGNLLGEKNAWINDYLVDKMYHVKRTFWYFPVDGKKQLKNEMNFSFSLYDMLKVKEKEDPTIEIETFFSYRNTEIMVYFKGERMIFSMHINDSKGFSIKNKGDVLYACSFEKYDPEKIKEFWEHTFEQLEQKRRIKNIINPPTYHREKLLSFFIEKEKIKEKMVMYLQQHHTPLEIEHLCAVERKAKKVKMRLLESFEEVKMKSLAHYLVIMTNEDVYFFTNEHSEEAYECFKEKSEEWMKEKFLRATSRTKRNIESWKKRQQ